MDKAAFKQLEACYFLEDRQFLVYNFDRFAYNWNRGVSVSWNEAFKENCRISDTLNQVISTHEPKERGGVCFTPKGWLHENRQMVRDAIF